MIFGSFLDPFFIDFSCFFRNPSRRPFLEVPSAGFHSKVRFWSDFRFSKGPKIRSGSACGPPERLRVGCSLAGSSTCSAPQAAVHPTCAPHPNLQCHCFLFTASSLLQSREKGGLSEPRKIKMESILSFFFALFFHIVF